jgi:hypothetical protein
MPRSRCRSGERRLDRRGGRLSIAPSCEPRERRLLMWWIHGGGGAAASGPGTPESTRRLGRQGKTSPAAAVLPTRDRVQAPVEEVCPDLLLGLICAPDMSAGGQPRGGCRQLWVSAAWSASLELLEALIRTWPQAAGTVGRRKSRRCGQVHDEKADVVLGPARKEASTEAIAVNQHRRGMTGRGMTGMGPAEAPRVGVRESVEPRHDPCGQDADPLGRHGVVNSSKELRGTCPRGDVGGDSAEQTPHQSPPPGAHCSAEM